MLEVNGISKFYGSTMAIQDISFSASKGQIIGLVGHKGSGKSTTMNIITHCLLPSSGTVNIDGVCIQDNPIAAKSKIGYLPEIPPVYADMLVEEQLEFVCGLRNIPAKRHNVEIDRVCDALAISGVRKRLIGNLSKGYRQRVGFAQALIGSPELLILDEPTVGLDPKQIIELRALITELKSEHTILLSSHILSEIAATCDRVVILSNGRVVTDDTLEGLLEHASAQEGILLQADGNVQLIMNAVRNVPGVRDIRLLEEQPDNATFHIKSQKGVDIHVALFHELTRVNCPIRALKPVQVGLEDVFLQLTHDQRYTANGKEQDNHGCSI